MMLLLETVIVLIDHPRIGSKDCFTYCVAMKIPVAYISKITIEARAWSCKPILCGIYCLLNVYIVAMGSL